MEEQADVITEEDISEEVDETPKEIEADGESTAEDTDDAQEEGGDEVVTFGDDEVPEVEEVAAPKWVGELRKKNRELARENATLKKQTAKIDETLSPLSAKPTLKDADYDEDKYESNLSKWYTEKRAHDDAKTASEATAKSQKAAWEARMGEYNEGKTSYDPTAIEDAEAAALEVLTQTQQGVLIEALGKGAAPLLIGLAANEKRLKALASITNPIRFAAESARLASIMKTSTRKPKTSPESRVTGSGAPMSGDKTLEKLEAEADKTGDRSAIIAFKRKQRLANK